MAERKPTENKIKKVVFAEHFYFTLVEVLTYGLEEFGSVVAYNFNMEIESTTQNLSNLYLAFPENKFLPTKTKIYRNIVLGKYMILYRIKPTTVEVLAIYHSSIKPSKIKKLRSLKP
ncbi:MAG: type II toxin-antitoxin system RelE/ParE family toxin [Bacteroidales bacterium]|nr:type II toxin-antitoxin system RelE/ParE family toxin [Bacteroidales bacterium]